jgi:nucleotide-binding universal stress UspA family protein
MSGAYLAPAIRPRLLACVDDSPANAAVLPHAKAVAQALGLPVTLGRVIETPHLRSPTDPIEWKLSRDRHQARLAELARQNPVDGGMASILLSGAPADELAMWARENGATVLALARRRSPGGHGLGSTAQRLLEHGAASLLLVPPMETPQSARYRRILVPIDGSDRSESVLPVATRMAKAHNAQLLLVHVVPQMEIVDESRIPQLRELRDQIDAHNKRNGRGHLDSLRAKFAGDGLAVHAIVVGPGDPRVLLRHIAEEQQADLIVLSSHGRTGLTDTCCGSVAEYLAIHAPMPLLLVRPNLVCRFPAPAAGPKDQAGTRTL